MTARVWAQVTIVPLVLAPMLTLAACNRHNPPSDQLAESARQIVGVATPTPAPFAKGPYAPRDTCHAVAGADQFRRKLYNAVMARDADAFVALAAQDIKLTPGPGDTVGAGASGRAALKQRLTDKGWDMWDELDRLLRLGCAANDQGGITIPWYYEQHITKVDPTTGMLVTGENVPLLSAPDPKSMVLETISWDVVTLGTPAPDDPYQPVTALDGKQGYIATNKLRSLTDYRLKAIQRNGNWRIVSLVSGSQS